MSIRRLTTVAILLASPLAASSAQSYARSASDTLRFHEVTNGEITLTAPQGEIAMKTEHDARIGVLVLPGDSARAWYEALRVSAEGPAGTMSPDTKDLIGKAFRLGFDARGHVAMREAPQLPQSLAGVSDLSHQFDDFFLRLPAQPLKLGVAWTDTVVRSDSAADKMMRSQTIGVFRVERDTVVAGEPAFVVSSRQILTSQSDGPVPGQPMHAHVVLTGTDDGWFLFTKSGRYLGRQRTGALKGDLTMTGGGNSMSMTQAYKYTSHVDAVK